jgi:hypothetical protein
MIKIGDHYDTTYGTLWKDGTYFPRGTRVLVVGVHLDQGFCVRFPAEVDGEPLETWEAWREASFLAPEGTVRPPERPFSHNILREARSVLGEAEDGSHVHVHDDDV